MNIGTLHYGVIGYKQQTENRRCVLHILSLNYMTDSPPPPE
jgi:hypothetical protein